MFYFYYKKSNIALNARLATKKVVREAKNSYLCTANGEVLEWLKRRAWKVRMRQKCIGGSNPFLSAMTVDNHQLAGFTYK